jgi:hypothetical protein
MFGTVSGFQLGVVTPGWTSSETPNTGITVTITLFLQVQGPQGPQDPQAPIQVFVGVVVLQQQLPQELTN